MGSDGRPYTMSNRLFFRRSGHSVWVHLHLFLRSFSIQTHNVTVSLSNSFCFHWLHISQGNTIFHSTKQSPVCSGQPYGYYGVQYWHTSPIIHKKGVDRGGGERSRARSITLRYNFALKKRIYLFKERKKERKRQENQENILSVFNKHTCIEWILRFSAWISLLDKPQSNHNHVLTVFVSV